MGQFFHVFNRGVEKRDIFLSDRDYERFFTTAALSRLAKAPQTSLFFRQQKLGLIPKNVDLEKQFGPPIVEIIAYCGMPNHYHFLLKELENKTVAKFMQRLGNGYTRYFNTRNNREGRLFTTQYKTVPIKNDEQLIHVSRYIHLNPYMSSRVGVSLEKLRVYPWSSLRTYLDTGLSYICQPREVLRFFSSQNDYWKFVEGGVAELSDDLERFSKLLIDAKETHI